MRTPDGRVVVDDADIARGLAPGTTARERAAGLLPRRQRRQRRPSLAAALKQASDAGVPVAGATIEDGKVSLTFGEGVPSEANNPWLADLDKVTKQ
jgi:hypothetical protein